MGEAALIFCRILAWIFILSEIFPGAQHNFLMLNCTDIRENEIYGRYLVSKNNLKKGDTIIEEIPIAIGPKLNTTALCLECFCKVSSLKDGSRCPKCLWPMCDECIASGAKIHKPECEIFSNGKQKFYPTSEDSVGCPQLDCITVLRVLLKKEEDPERWEKEVECMEYHDLARRTEVETWNADLNNVAKYLRGPCKLQRFSEDLIMQVIGILEVNAFEGRTAAGYVFRGLYPMTGILAHNCVPNTSRSIYPSENYRIRLRAMVDLKEGQQLNHSYTYTLSGTRYRQEHLKSGKFFICKCERCVDPTELGTHFSSFKCTKCEYGWFHSTNPIDGKAEWKCTSCPYKLSGETVQKATIAMQMEIDQAMAMDNSAEKIEVLERISRKFKSLLHPLHYMNTGMRQSLIEMYGRVPGYGLADLPDVLLEHKQDICEQVLRVLDKFEPGISRSRAFTLYEMHVPIVLLAKSAFIAGVLTTENLKDRLQQAIDVLEESISILKYEDKSSQEGGLCTLAETAVRELKTSIESL